MATRSRRRTLFRALAWLMGAVLVLAVAVSLFRAKLVGIALEQVAASGGFQLSIARIESPSWSELALHDVRLAPRDPTDALRSITIDELRVRFSIPRLIGGGLDGLHRIDGRGLVVHVDLTIPSKPDSGGGPSVWAVLTDIARVLPESSIERARVELVTPAVGTIRVGDGVLRAREDRLELDTPIDAFGGRANARVTLADGRLSALVDARAMGYAGRSIDWLRGELAIDDARIAARDLWIALGSSIVDVAYLDVPLPIDDWCTLKRTVRGAVRIEVDDLPEVLGEVLGEDVASAFPPHHLALSGRVRDGFVELGPGRLTMERGELVIERGSAPIADSVRELLEDPALDVALSVDIDDARQLGAILGPLAGDEPWSGRVEGDLTVRGGTRGPSGHMDLFASRVSAFGRRVDWLSAQASLDAERLRVARIDARVPGASVSATGAYRLDDEELEDVELTASVPELAALGLPGLASGRAKIDATARGRWPDLDATVSVAGRDIVWRGTDPGWASVLLRARRGELIALDAELDAGCEHARASGAFSLPDAWGTWRGRLDALRVSSGAAALELIEPCEVSVDGSSIELAGLHLSGSAGDARVDLSLDTGVGDVRLRLSAFDPSPLRPFVPMRFTCASVSANIDASWSPSALTASLDGSCDELSLDPRAPPLDLSFAMTYADARLLVERFDAMTFGEPIASFRGTLPLDLRGETLLADGPLEARGSLAIRDLSLLPQGLQDLARARTGTLFADVEVAGTWLAPRGRVVVGGASILWPHEQGLGPWSFDGAFDLAEDLTIDDFEIELEGGARTIVTGTVKDLDGVAHALAMGESPNPIVEVDVTFGARDLASFAERSPVRLRRLGGVLDGKLSIRGRLDEPTIHGALHLTEGELRTTTTLPSIQGLVADLAFDGSVVDVQRVHGELGGAPFELTGSYHLSGDERGARLELSGENLLLYRQQDLTLRANAKLEIEGPPEALTIRGEMALSDSRFTRDIDWLALPTSKARRANVRGIELFSITDPPLASARFDVAVRSAEPLRIVTNRVQGRLRPDLTLRGTGELPILVGTIQIDPTRVRLPASTIKVRSGHIEFLASDPFVPRVEIAADARLRGYDVTIGVSGEYDKPVVTLASAPPMAREDLLLLVLTGRAPGAGGSDGLDADLDAAGDVVVFLAGDALGSIFGTDPSADADDAMVDRFELESGQDVTQKGAPTMRASLLLRRDVTRENDALYLTGERDVYDRYNYGLRLVFRFP